VDHHDEEKPRRYLRKRQLRERYGYASDRAIERLVELGRLPEPDIYMGRNPLWSEETLDAHDRAASRALPEKRLRRKAQEGEAEAPRAHRKQRRKVTNPK
jgi:hypothetical protein